MAVGGDAAGGDILKVEALSPSTACRPHGRHHNEIGLRNLGEEALLRPPDIWSLSHEGEEDEDECDVEAPYI